MPWGRAECGSEAIAAGGRTGGPEDAGVISKEQPARLLRPGAGGGRWVHGAGGQAPGPPAASPPAGGEQVGPGPQVSRQLTATIWCCSSLQSLGRMGRMVGGSRTPSSMWITPLEASTSTLRSGTPSGPSRMRPCSRARCTSCPARQAPGPTAALTPTARPAGSSSLSLAVPPDPAKPLQTPGPEPHGAPAPETCAHPPRLWSRPALLGSRRGI